MRRRGCWRRSCNSSCGRRGSSCSNAVVGVWDLLLRHYEGRVPDLCAALDWEQLRTRISSATRMDLGAFRRRVGIAGGTPNPKVDALLAEAAALDGSNRGTEGLRPGAADFGGGSAGNHAVVSGQRGGAQPASARDCAHYVRQLRLSAQRLDARLRHLLPPPSLAMTLDGGDVTDEIPAAVGDARADKRGSCVADGDAAAQGLLR